jgi:hypothetical protein
MDLQAYLFSPAAAREERFRHMRQKRKTRVQPSQSCRRKARPRKGPGERYTVGSYRRAIVYACQRAFPLPDHLTRQRNDNDKRETVVQWKSRLTNEEHAEIRAWWRQHRWHPHQLRHNAATDLRKQYGIELARIVLGHRSAFVTEIYAEADRQQAVEVIARIG